MQIQTKVGISTPYDNEGDIYEIWQILNLEIFHQIWKQTCI